MSTLALEALFPQPLRGILAVLYGNVERWWTLRELACELSSRPQALRARLSMLTAAGVVRCRMDGRNRVFQADSACTYFPELRAMFLKREAQTGPAEPDGRGAILVVEDEPATLQLSRILLESWGFLVLDAHGPEEAMRIFERHEPSIRLLLTDIAMPGMNGKELAAHLRQRKPDLRVVFMSGTATAESHDGETSFLPKPFSPDRLEHIVRELLNSH